MVAISKLKFGRVYIGDERDVNYTYRSKKTSRQHRYWNQSGWYGDQKATSQCVAYAWVHWLEDGPITHGSRKPPLFDPAFVYAKAQDLDEFEGSAYEGTSIRGGAKAMQQLGCITEYRWCFDLSTLVNAILETGPVVVGTVWWSGMFEPNKSGLVRARGIAAGGHAYVVNGVNVGKGLFRIKNSWGRGWGIGGSAFVPFEDMALLLERMDGEACLAIEVPDGN